MATFENTVAIRRPVEDVFAFLADFENVPAWNYAIVETKKTSPGPVGVGTTYRQVRSVPSRSEEGFQVTVFEPPSRLEVHGDIGPFTATIGYLLAPADDGTRLTNVVDLESGSGVVRLLAPLAASRVKRAVAGRGRGRAGEAAPRAAGGGRGGRLRGRQSLGAAVGAVGAGQEPEEAAAAGAQQHGDRQGRPPSISAEPQPEPPCTPLVRW